MNRNDIQTEMIMNSDSSNVVNEIFAELNKPPKPPQMHQQRPQQMHQQRPQQMPQQMPPKPHQQTPQVQPNTQLNEGAVINQYDNKDISNEVRMNRQLDPYMNLNPDTKIDLKNKNNMDKLSIKNYSNNFLANPRILNIIRVLKNICLLFVILLIVLSPLTTKLLVKYMSKLYGTGASQLLKWFGLIIKALFVSVVFTVIKLFI